MTAFSVLFFFVSFLISTGKCFFLPAIPSKAAGGCYQTPPNNHGEDTTVVVDDAFWQKMGAMMDEKLDEKLDSIDKRFDSVDKRFESADKKLDEKLDSINKRFESADKKLDEKLDSINKRFESADEKLDKRFESADKKLDEKLDKRFESADEKLDEKLKPIHEKLDRVDKRTGLLVEEIARKHATREFGENFSRSFTIKSIHDLVALISQADTETLPYGDTEARFRAAEKVIDFLYPLLPVFLEAAVEHVVKTFDEEAVFNLEAFRVAKQKIRDVQEKLKEDTQPDKARLVEYCGTVLGSVNELGTAPINGESKTDQVARQKKVKELFKGKLERFRKSMEDEGGRGLATNEGAGILMCNALATAGRTVWEGGETSMSDWIREQRVLDFKGEIECDLHPLAKKYPADVTQGRDVTLMVGEI